MDALKFLVSISAMDFKKVKYEDVLNGTFMIW